MKRKHVALLAPVRTTSVLFATQRMMVGAANSRKPSQALVTGLGTSLGEPPVPDDLPDRRQSKRPTGHQLRLVRSQRRFL